MSGARGGSGAQADTRRAVPPLRVAVSGGGVSDDDDAAAALEVGRAVAEAGAVLVTGGRTGVMEAASRGAFEAGGVTVGILPGDDADEANAWVTVPIATGMGQGRNILVVRAADAVVAIGGEWGTLSEVALARKLDVPVVLLRPTLTASLELPVADDPAAAVRMALEAARARRERSTHRNPRGS